MQGHLHHCVMNQKGEMIQTQNTLTNTNIGTVPSLLHFLIQLPWTCTCTDRRTGRKTPEQGESGAASSRVSASYSVYYLPAEQS